jgi:hypothetical protein
MNVITPTCRVCGERGTLYDVDALGTMTIHPLVAARREHSGRPTRPRRGSA